MKIFNSLLLSAVLSMACSLGIYGQYCPSTYNNACTSGDFLDGVVFESINNTGTGCTNPGANNYVDYRGTFGATVTQGQSYTITATSGPSWGQYMAAAIDFDQDGTYNGVGEFFDIGYSAAGVPVNGTITIPGTATTGLTTMRVFCQFGTTVLTQADICAALSYGEAEEYDLTIIAPVPNEAGISAITAPSSGCGLTAAEIVTVDVTNYGTSPVTSIDVSYSFNGGAPVVETMTTPIASLATESYSFTTPVNASSFGTYTVDAWTTLTGDVVPSNDSIIGYSFDNIPLVGTLPYSEDFEAGNGGWTASGANSSWAYGTPAGVQINAPANIGTGAWVTNLSGDYNASEFSYLESPCFDFSGITDDPVLRFDFNFLTESCCDEGWVEVSTDAGTTWSKLLAGPSAANWYNDTGNQWWDGAATTGWTNAQNNLTGTAGSSSVKIRYVFSSDGSVQEEGFGVDNINILFGFDDAQVSLVNALSGCGLTTAETIGVTITNTGTDTLTTIPVCYTIDGGAPICETATITLAPGFFGSYTFTATADLSVVGNYSISGFTMLPGDFDNSNDTTTIIVSSIPTFSGGLPYVEDFEAGDGGWTASGANSSWAYGVPAGPVINSAGGCGTQAWVTNLTGDYNTNENSFLTSPCFDFSSLTADPTFRFDLNFDSESCCDEGWVDISVDGGTTWTRLGTSGTGTNWYNDATNQWWDGAFTTGWQQAEQVLLGAAGQSSVRIRFGFSSDGSVQNDGFGIDNIFVFDNLDDALSAGVSSPVSGCGLSATEPIVMDIVNNGTNPMTNIPVCFSVDGAAPVCETAAITVAPGATASYTFTGTADFSVAGTYVVDVYTSLVGDAFVCNDTASTTIVTAPIVAAFPYSADFETGQEGWYTYGTPNTWAAGVPAGATISSAGGCGSQAWVTNLTGDHDANEASFVQGPCFDFSGLTIDPILQMEINYELGFGEEVQVQVSTDGGVTWAPLGVTAGPGTLNWYTDLITSSWDGSVSGGWIPARTPMTGLAGQSDVRIRFAMITDGFGGNEGFAFDNIMVYDMLTDITPVAVGGPMSSCGLTSAEVLTADITNFGSAAVTSVDACYSVNAGTPVCETFTVSLAPDSTVTVTFATPVDFSGVGSYDIQVVTSLIGDGITCNDTSDIVSIDNIPVISTLPYLETFESGRGGWTSGGTNSSWDFGTPTKPTIVGAASGVNAFTTGGLGSGTYNANEDSYVISPCFDMTAAPTDLWVAMKIWYNSEFSWDGAVLQSTIDSGATWVNVGAFGDPDNWYTDNTINGNPGGQQEGWTGRASTSDGSGGWVQAKHPLDPALSGQMNVRFRVAFASDGSVQDDGFAFDDFAIGQLPAVNIGMDTMTLCEGSMLDAGAFGGTYAWSDGSTSQMIMLNGPFVDSTIAVMVTDSLGLCNTDTAIITVNAALSATTTVTSNYNGAQISCVGAADGAAMTTVTGGAAPLSYAWVGSASTTNLISGVGPGMYIVNVTDAVGCTVADTVMISDPVVLSSSIGGTNVSCAGADDGTATITATGGTGAIAYAWSTTPAQTTATATGLAPGAYTVTATDGNGCTTVENITITAPSAIVTTVLSQTDESAPGALDGSIDITVTGGVAPYTYAWSNGSTSQDLFGIAGGSYTVTITDALGCSITEGPFALMTDASALPASVQSLNISPVPASDFMTVALELAQTNDVELTLYDATGRMVSDAQFASGNSMTMTIDVTQLPSAMYLVRLRVGSEYITRQVIVSH